MRVPSRFLPLLLTLFVLGFSALASASQCPLEATPPGISVEMVRIPQRGRWGAFVLGQTYRYQIEVKGPEGHRVIPIEISDQMDPESVFFRTVLPDQNQLIEALTGRTQYYEADPLRRRGTVTRDGNFSFGMRTGHLEIDPEGQFVPRHLRH